MAPTHIVAASAVDSVNQDVELSHRVAALLVHLQPRKNPERIVHELLDQLKTEKLSREARGLNHWSQHAPQFLSGIVRQARREKERRYQEAAAFYKTRHREVLRFTRAIVMDDAAAETVASDTYRELLEGSATIPGFFTALVCNARNYLEAAAYRRDRFVPVDEAFTPSFSIVDNEGGEGAILLLEPMSHRLEDQDPLDILIAREEEIAHRQMVAVAKEDPRWRYIKLRDWAAPLAENVRN